MDKEKQREQARLRKQRQRDILKRDTVTNVTQSVTKATNNVTLDVTQYPDNMKPLLCALGDPVKRDKLRAICESLSSKDLLKHVRYGCYGVTMHTVSELLEAF